MFAQSMVYEPLVKYQADGSVVPWLASRWDTLAGRLKPGSFTLRKDVTFFQRRKSLDAYARRRQFSALFWITAQRARLAGAGEQDPPK
ncbi:Nickel-binding periplasmic protein precursor [Kluyvera cryocrescens]|uniref:Nickel-binding periplasmic protein n=1 Tax=Kluyvera cryocrescens TaxID=580 RepID=A0A485ABV0_KLUCR|nr:Nickel-binding periplasmic protein precursor [Kluyvera cryocrescens]